MSDDPTPSRTRREQIAPYTTRDGSEIRELLHPDHHRVGHQSLAEATVAPGAATRLHRHRLSEELYHVTTGSGWMTLGERRFRIGPGDSIAIAPGTPHRLENDGTTPLRLLCCCAPPYRHDDTELLDG